MSFIIILFYCLQLSDITIYTRENSGINQELAKDIFNILISKEKSLKYSIKYFKNYEDGIQIINENKNKDNVCVINSISITKKRLIDYDFSFPYFPVKHSIIALKSFKMPEDKSKWIVAIHKEMDFIDAIQKSDESKMIQFKIYANYTELLADLKSGKIHAFVGDLIMTWAQDSYVSVLNLESIPNANFGILFPKGSQLKEKVDPIIRYYVKTSRFYQLVKKYFGEDASNYFKNL